MSTTVDRIVCASLYSQGNVTASGNLTVTGAVTAAGITNTGAVTTTTYITMGAAAPYLYIIPSTATNVAEAAAAATAVAASCKGSLVMSTGGLMFRMSADDTATLLTQ